MKILVSLLVVPKGKKVKMANLVVMVKMELHHALGIMATGG